MTTYAQAAASVRQPNNAPSAQEPIRTHCCASGCPLPGSISTSTNGADEWLCQFHFGAPYSDYAMISAGLNNRIGLLSQAMKFINAPTGTSFLNDQGKPRQDIVDMLTRHGQPDLIDNMPAKAPKFIHTLGATILATIGREVQARQKTLMPGPTRQPAAGHQAGWTDSRAAVEQMRQVTQQRKKAA